MNKKIFCYASMALLLFACKPESKSINTTADSHVEQQEEKTLKSYDFTVNKLSSVDIAEAKPVIYAFRRLNNAINDKNPANIDKTVQDQYVDIIQSHIAPSFSEENRTKVKNFLDATLNELKDFFHSKDYEQNRAAGPGQAGMLDLQSDDGEARVLNKNGVQLGQVIQKDLIGSLQISNIFYFLDKALKAEDKMVSGKNYTEKEHNWDIAYGYLGTLSADKERITTIGLANYIEKEAVGMKGLEDVNVSIYNAFYYGRKALVEKHFDVAAKKAAFIKTMISKIVLIRCNYYFNDASKLVENQGITKRNTEYFNQMAEALGFLLCIPFVESDPQIGLDQCYQWYSGIVNQDKGLWNDSDNSLIISLGKGSITDIRKEISKSIK